ncbi:hypothetical protein V1477_001308 [Vespula maculifrons]|uniref:Uncharacterized protein n=1 Tax=Vespula maculifrons TaxID=7453 RepID=A0ABD2CZF0_VESMC
MAHRADVGIHHPFLPDDHQESFVVSLMTAYPFSIHQSIADNTIFMSEYLVGSSTPLKDIRENIKSYHGVGSFYQYNIEKLRVRGGPLCRWRTVQTWGFTILFFLMT